RRIPPGRAPGHGPTAGAPDLVDDAVRVSLIGEEVDAHRRALTREAYGDGSSQPPRGAGDERRLPFHRLLSLASARGAPSSRTARCSFWPARAACCRTGTAPSGLQRPALSCAPGSRG